MLIGIRVCSLDHFPFPSTSLAFYLKLPADFYEVGEMTVADKLVQPQHFRSDLADIRIRINPEIRFRMSGHFWLRLWPWGVCGLRAHLVFIVLRGTKALTYSVHCTGLDNGEPQV